MAGRPKNENGESKTATERRVERIAKRKEKLAEKMATIRPDDLFEKAAKEVSVDARAIHKAVQEWLYGDIEMEDLMVRLRSDYRVLEGSLNRLAQANKLITGK